jgi:hypothetical protein
MFTRSHCGGATHSVLIYSLNKPMKTKKNKKKEGRAKEKKKEVRQSIIERERGN